MTPKPEVRNGIRKETSLRLENMAQEEWQAGVYYIINLPNFSTASKINVAGWRLDGQCSLAN